MECAEAVDGIKAGDRVAVDADTGTIANLTTGQVFHAQPFPGFIQEIIAYGGLIPRTKALLAKGRAAS